MFHFNLPFEDFRHYGTRREEKITITHILHTCPFDRIPEKIIHIFCHVLLGCVVDINEQ